MPNSVPKSRTKVSLKGKRQEGNPRRSIMGAPTAAMPAPVAAPPQPVSTSDDVVQASVILPTVANDDDLIEKEWVDKAKKVLAATKDDPYRREQEVNRLQADYLLKRYGRELGSTQ